jgi:hypothetical protein
MAAVVRWVGVAGDGGGVWGVAVKVEVEVEVVDEKRGGVLSWTCSCEVAGGTAADVCRLTCRKAILLYAGWVLLMHETECAGAAEVQTGGKVRCRAQDGCLLARVGRRMRLCNLDERGVNR